MFLMWGYEGETPDDMAETIDLVKRANPDVFFTTVAYPIKGTPYHREVEHKLIAIRDWKTSTDRDVLVRGRHSRRYFQFADELLSGTIAADAGRIAAARSGLHEYANEVDA